MRSSLHVSVYTFTHVCVYAFTNAYMCAHSRMYVCMHSRIYAYISVYATNLRNSWNDGRVRFCMGVSPFMIRIIKLELSTCKEWTLYLYIYIHTHLGIYIYTYLPRDAFQMYDKDDDGGGSLEELHTWRTAFHCCVCPHVCINMYVYLLCIW